MVFVVALSFSCGDYFKNLEVMEKIFNFTKKKKFQYNAVLSFKYQVKDGSY